MLKVPRFYQQGAASQNKAGQTDQMRLLFVFFKVLKISTQKLQKIFKNSDRISSYWLVKNTLRCS